MSIFQLLNESGATGGNYRRSSHTEDLFPSLTLEECTSMIPLIVSESALEMKTEENETLYSLTEAAVAGDYDRIDAINEGAFTSFKDSIVKFYNKVKEFIKSIIAKIKQWIASVFKTGEKLVNQYEDMVKKKDLKGMTFTGYKFVNDFTSLGFTQGEWEIAKDGTIKTGNTSLNKVMGENIETEIAKVLNSNESNVSSNSGKGWDKNGELQNTWKTTEKAIDKVKSNPKEMQIKIYAEFGVTVKKPDELTKEMFKLFRNGKDQTTEMKYGSDFNSSDIIARIKKTDEIDEIIQKYEDFEEKVETSKDNLVDFISDLEDKADPKTDADRARLSAKVSILRFNQFIMEKYISCSSSLRGQINEGFKQRNAQDKKMFIAMMNYKEKKSKNNSYEEFADDVTVDFNFDF